MLTLCLACALGVTGVRAQTFAPVPYHFAAAPESAPVFPSGSSEIVGSMAANGYGLWLSGYYGGYAYAWRLAGCGLKGTTPSGTVAFGSDDQGITPAPQDTKVATNLLGSVRYVCVNSTDDGFIISGIDDAQCGSKSDQISINFPYDQHNNLLSTPSDANIVGGNSGKEYVYPGVSTAVGDEWGQPPPPEKELEPVGDASGAGEHDPIDWDIAIDGHYLYIVWHHVETYPTDPESRVDEIFVTCVVLKDGTVPAGFPITLHDRINPYTGAGVGTQPTVACDVRNNSSGTFTPQCEIAYVDDNTPKRAWHISVTGSTASAAEELPTGVLEPWDPTDPHNSPNPYNSTTLPTVFRARIMVASSGSGMQNHVIGYYVIAGSGTALYFFDEKDGVFQGAPNGWYVDGPINPANLPATDWAPEASPIGTYGQYVGYNSTHQMVAFANPYDGQDNGGFDEFHCVYSATGTAADHSSYSAIMIARGADNGMPWPTQPFLYPNDTRTVVNQSSNTLPLIGIGGNPFFAAVNQAGIHVRWDDGTDEWYARDRRSFDEPIEENTILSYDNYIADGSNHGGTVGAQTLAGKSVLVWTDPALYNTAPADGDHARIFFGTAGTDPVTFANSAGLTVGTNSSTDPSVKLTFFPNFTCQFQDQPITGNRNFIQVDRSAICDYYAGTFFHNLEPPPTFIVNEIQNNFLGGGDFILNSNAATTAPLATLNIMPCCDFTMVNDGTSGFPRFISNNGDGTVNAMNGTGEDHVDGENGSLTIDGAMTLDHAAINCDALFQMPPVNVITLNGEENCPFSTSVTHSTLYDNNVFSSFEQFFVNDPLDAVTFDHNTMNAIELYVWYALHTSDNPIPSRPLTVTNGTFQNIPMQGIFLQRDYTSGADATVDYAQITLDGNTFENFLARKSDGILLEDFTPNVPGDLSTTQIEIESNIFSTPSVFGYPQDTSHVQAAVHLMNSSAVVDDNTIDGEQAAGAPTYSTFAYGIWQDLSPSGELQTKIANSLLCHNTISYVGYAPVGTTETGSGISTTYWKGYEKKNEISNSAQGSIYGGSDQGAYLLANYHDNQGPGINNNATSEYVYELEMRGLIHPPDYSGDMAGYNEINGNNLDHVANSGEVVVGSGVILHIGNEYGTGSPDVAYGMNSFLDNGGTDRLFYTTTSTSITDWGDIGGDAGGIDNNYYEVGGSAYTPPQSNTTSPSNSELEGLYYDNGNPPSLQAGVPTPPTIYCYGGSEITKHHEITPASMTTLSDTLSASDCAQMADHVAEYDRGDSTDDQVAYDSAKDYLTLCTNQRSAISMFVLASGANDNRGDYPNSFVEFREWLKSVLYLRTDTEWYCADVFQIAHTFLYYPGHGVYSNAMEAIVRYVLENQRCDSEWSYHFAHALNWPHVDSLFWRDTVKDSFTEPGPDTTVPSIDSIGLSILRGPPPAAVHPVQLASGTSEISGLSATENPFTNATEIKFDLADYGLVTFQLYDLLGNAVTTNGIGQVLYPGEHSFEVDGSKLATGTYIARVAFHDGDVESIMVVKK